MPIAAGTTIIQTQIKNSFSLAEGANVAATAQIIALGVANIAPMGLFPVAPIPTPLAPTGLSGGQKIIENALSLGGGAEISAVSQMIALGISMIAPVAPPAGLSTLASQIKSAFSLQEGAEKNTVGDLIGLAVPIYYQTGGVI